ncbi:conjugal transfer protein TraN [Candidatus Skiveiella danica]|uniref:conjugal transfer protein TraN n=1 Tax=Candidatus Skiveiella danica TaxID=3386177 RepID=UPI0009C7FC47|nr:MAG: conjugal transfer mating pair stabilization protein TraN [Alphaproteobacteria bacterium ADurb.Bin100]
MTAIWPTQNACDRWLPAFAALAALAAVILLASPSPSHAADCVKNSEVCVEGPATRNIGGHLVYRDCWRTTSEFSCLSQNSTDDCQPLVERGCSQVGSNCVDTNAQGACMVFEQTWQCRVASGATSTVTNCGSQQFCIDGQCFDTSHAPDADFARAIAGLEVQREAGQYIDPNTLVVFQGYDNRCRKKLFGLVNCCKGGGSGGSSFSNMSLIAGAASQVAGAVGSSYTFDALFTSDAPDVVIQGFEALFGAGGGSSALAGLMAGDLSVSSFIETLVPGPWSLAMLAIQLSGLLSCDQAEQILAMKKDNRLCHSVGSYCSARIPIIRTCIQTTQTYCCFNSRLARILNEQGRAQLVRSWGGAKSPDCSGFTVAQLQSLDFSRMDLTEFYAEIAPKMLDVGALRQKAQQRVDSYFAP